MSRVVVSTTEAEAGGSHVPIGHPGVYSKTPSKRKEKKSRQDHKYTLEQNWRQETAVLGCGEGRRTVSAEELFFWYF